MRTDLELLILSNPNSFAKHCLPFAAGYVIEVTSIKDEVTVITRDPKGRLRQFSLSGKDVEFWVRNEKLLDFVNQKT